MPQLASFITSDEMEAKSWSVLRKHGIDAPPIDPILIAKYEGIGVFYAEFDKENVAGLLRKENDEWEILVNALDPPKRQRFTIAHELGHYFLHEDLKETEFVDPEMYIFRSSELNISEEAKRLEVQANMFAASLLMPRSMVVDAMFDTEDLGNLSQIFFVSRAAIGHRVSRVIDIDA